MFRTHRQIQHQRTEQTSQRHRQERVPGGAHQPSERKWKEPRVPGASLDRVDIRAGTSGSHLLLRQTRGVRGRGEHGSGGRVEKGDALWSSFISDHGCTVETSFHVHRRRTDGMQQKYFRDAYAASRCCDDRSTPERITWCYGEWQEAYATMDLVDLRFEEGLPSASMFDSSTRNLIVIDDLMAETDERVTTLFTKKSHHRNTSVLYLVQNLFPKTKRVVPSV